MMLGAETPSLGSVCFALFCAQKQCLLKAFVLDTNPWQCLCRSCLFQLFCARHLFLDVHPLRKKSQHIHLIYLMVLQYIAIYSSCSVLEVAARARSEPRGHPKWLLEATRGCKGGDTCKCDRASSKFQGASGHLNLIMRHYPLEVFREAVLANPFFMRK